MTARGNARRSRSAHAVGVAQGPERAPRALGSDGYPRARGQRARSGWSRPALVAGAAGLIALGVAVSPSPAETVSLAELRERTHFHGLAVDPAAGERLLLATHHGFFAVSPDGRATRLSEDRNDYMGFTPHPSPMGGLFASGHPEGGGNLGFIVSHDGGKSWRQLSPGARGPVDFHQMDVSKADPRVVYGAYKGLQRSRDGGKTWEMVAPLPERLIDLAASAHEVERLYAATERGLLLSTDGGRSWALAHEHAAPATLVQTGHEGDVYAFLFGIGLVKTVEPALRWELLSDGFGERYLLHLAVDPRDGERLYAVTQENELLASRDGGRTWAPFAGD